MNQILKGIPKLGITTTTTICINYQWIESKHPLYHIDRINLLIKPNQLSQIKINQFNHRGSIKEYPLSLQTLINIHSINNYPLTIQIINQNINFKLSSKVIKLTMIELKAKV